MDVDALRAQAQTVMFATIGVPITVTPPQQDAPAVVTTGIWISEAGQTLRGPSQIEEPRQIGSEFQRREPRKVLAIPRDAVLSTLPRGSFIQAAEALGGPVRTWRTDGFDRVEPDVWRVIVVLVADP